jgi:uncharacterized membrane protein YjgN (DUF898 family)
MCATDVIATDVIATVTTGFFLFSSKRFLFFIFFLIPSSFKYQAVQTQFRGLDHDTTQTEWKCSELHLLDAPVHGQGQF